MKLLTFALLTGLSAFGQTPQADAIASRGGPEYADMMEGAKDYYVFAQRIHTATLSVACKIVSAQTADKKVSDLTAAEFSQVTACQQGKVPAVEIPDERVAELRKELITSIPSDKLSRIRFFIRVGISPEELTDFDKMLLVSKP